MPQCSPSITIKNKRKDKHSQLQLHGFADPGLKRLEPVSEKEKKKKKKKGGAWLRLETTSLTCVRPWF
jgi:hypothetical protein